MAILNVSRVCILFFLGDYCDRGMYGTEILELLLQLREENPQQVHLIRGNHEYVNMNASFRSGDKKLEAILKNSMSEKALEDFYDTMCLSSYFSLQSEEKREYIQFTHGLFEISMDPAPLLDKGESGSYAWVPQERKLSERICKISQRNSPLSKHALRVVKLFNTYLEIGQLKDTDFEDDGVLLTPSSLCGAIAEEDYFAITRYSSLTAYNWGDVQSEYMPSVVGALDKRQYKLSSKDIWHYLRTSSDQNQVKMLIRGHQHKFSQAEHKGDVFITTLTVGINSPPYQGLNRADFAYILTLNGDFSDWTKRIMLRERNHDVTAKITKESSLSSHTLSLFE